MALPKNSLSHIFNDFTGNPSAVSTDTQPSAKNHSEKPTAILCLDLGTQTGWALQSEQGIVVSGTHSLQQNRYVGGGARFLKFVSFLQHFDNEYTFESVYFEAVRRHLGTDAAHVYGGFVAVLTAWCEKRDIAYEGVPVGTIKKHATGKGNANKTAMIDAMRAKGYEPQDDNEADALALLHWALDYRRVKV